jgi:hypothetical protein
MMSVAATATKILPLKCIEVLLRTEAKRSSCHARTAHPPSRPAARRCKAYNPPLLLARGDHLGGAVVRIDSTARNLLR